MTANQQVTLAANTMEIDGANTPANSIVEASLKRSFSSLTNQVKQLKAKMEALKGKPANKAKPKPKPSPNKHQKNITLLQMLTTFWTSTEEKLKRKAREKA